MIQSIVLDGREREREREVSEAPRIGREERIGEVPAREGGTNPQTKMNCSLTPINLSKLALA